MRAGALAPCFVFACSILHAQAGTGITTFHVDPQRTGWWPGETTLTPVNVSGGNFGPIWNSPQFDIVGGETPHAYATPLYLRGVAISAGPYAGGTFNIIFAATSNGFVYAVNALSATVGTAQVPAGTIVWRKSLGIPATNINYDELPLGVLSTPVIDPTTSPARIYVACANSAAGWQVFALDVTSGNILPGWPLSINNSTVSSLNQNGVSAFQATNAVSQRGALNLSPDGTYLYIPFGGYIDSAPGWLVVVDTKAATIASAFSGAPSTAGIANAGMWAASGVAIDPAGNVYSTTGNGSTGNESTPGYWGNSLLAWKPGVPLTLFGTYTPFNYCQMDVGDIDVGGGGAMLIPNLGLVAFGGKQGNVYLLSVNNLPGSLAGRQGCGSDASQDTSLLPPGNQPQFGTRGPLNVFGPYSETNNNLDYAKARTTPAFFQGADGTPYIFASGSNKASMTSETNVPPGICRLKVVTGSQPYLAIDACQQTIVFMTPGSPVVTSNGTSNAILWELVANIPRFQILVGSSKPFFLALDPLTMNVLFQSAPGQLNEGGKYNSPLVVDGTVFIATDRIQAFGLLPAPPPPGVTLINSCGPAVSPFAADEFVAGGNCTTINVSVSFTPNVSCPAPPLQVFESKRTGNTNGGVAFTYTVPNLTPGQPYTACLYFMDDLNSVAGKRVFSVNINGATVLNSFDVAATAGGKNMAIVEAFTATPNSQNQVILQFNYGSAGNPIVSAIGLVPVSGPPPPPPTPPVITVFTSAPANIVAGQSATLSWSATGATSFSVNGNAVNGNFLTVSPKQTTTYRLTATNSGGSTTATTTVIVSTPPPAATLINSCGPAVSPFAADEFVAGGNCTTIKVSVTYTPNVSCPAPPLQVFESKRTGNTNGGVAFTYTVPNLTPGQPYTACLYFMDDLNGVAGKRLFSVNINGATVLNSFDVAATAGGKNMAIVEAFTATPNSQNQVVLQFNCGSAGNPIVSAIGLVPIVQ